MNIAREPVASLRYERDVALARARMDAAAWDLAWDQGGTMTVEDAVEYALTF